MATLAFVAEDSKCAFDIIHIGEDLLLLQDGYIYISLYFILEGLKDCKDFQTFQMVSHGEVHNIEDSKNISNLISREDRINIQDDKFVIYNHTFLDEDHPSNKGFEGRDFKCVGKTISLDDYNNISVPSNNEFKVRLVANYGSYSLIRFEFNNGITKGKRVAIRLGYLIEPITGKRGRLFLYPPEINHYFHFYTKRDLGVDVMEFLGKIDSENRIMDIRLKSPKREISTCDFFFMTRNEFIEGLSAPSKTKRIPFSRKELVDGAFLQYHIYPEDMPSLIPMTKEVNYNGERIKIPILKFDNNSALLLRICRTDKAIFYSILPIFLGVLGVFIGVNIEYEIGMKMNEIILFSLILTIISLLLLNKVFTKTRT